MAEIKLADVIAKGYFTPREKGAVVHHKDQMVLLDEKDWSTLDGTQNVAIGGISLPAGTIVKFVGVLKVPTDINVETRDASTGKMVPGRGNAKGREVFYIVIEYGKDANNLKPGSVPFRQISAGLPRLTDFAKPEDQDRFDKMRENENRINLDGLSESGRLKKFAEAGTFEVIDELVADRDVPAAPNGVIKSYRAYAFKKA